MKQTGVDMSSNIETAFARLIDALGTMDQVRAIGKTGGPDLPLDGDSDVDIFLFCDEIPDVQRRSDCLRALGEGYEIASLGSESGPYWGLLDFVEVQGLEICLMYFRCDEFTASLQGILRGERPHREGNYFYPTGRCASVLSMYKLMDRDGYLADLQRWLAEYPDTLAHRLMDCHRGRMNDGEDFGRAVARGDVLFYHATLDLAMDAFLQALFALNRRYFPSRKRSLQFIEGFAVKPDDCAASLLQVVKLGARPDTLEESHRLWTGLCQELEKQIERHTA